MKFPKFKPKDYTLIAVVAVAVLFVVYAIWNQREGFTADANWVLDDGTLTNVSITEDGTLWGITPDTFIWKKNKGGSWERVSGSAVQISGVNSTSAWCIGTDSGIQRTQDGGKTWQSAGGLGKWVSAAESGVLAIGTDSKVYMYNPPSNNWVIPSFGGMGTQISLGGPGVAQVITSDGYIWELVNEQWQNTGAPSKSVSIAKNGLSVEVSTDGNVYYKMPGQPQVKFNGTNIRQISASTTKLAAVTNDNKTQTFDVPALPTAGAPATPVAPTPAPAAAPGLTAGSQSASCPQCSVANGQISCSCDVLPKA